MADDFVRIYDSKKGKYVEVAKSKISSMEESGFWIFTSTKVKLDSGEEITVDGSADNIKRKLKG